MILNDLLIGPFFLGLVNQHLLFGRCAEVHEMTGFAKPTGLCVANDQLLVTDRGADEVRKGDFVCLGFVYIRCFLNK